MGTVLRTARPMRHCSENSFYPPQFCCDARMAPLGLLAFPLTDEFGNIDEIYLPSGSGVGGVEGDKFTIGAEAGVQVAAPFTGVFRGGWKDSEIDAAVGLDVIEVGDLISVFFTGIGVVQNPLVAGQIGAVSVDGHGAVADDFNVSRSVLVEIKFVVAGRVICPA